ncbi:MAG: hypothetical protein QOE92_292 [Chloroflexota bacterium]|jgi:DNA-binding transcriptional MerR regulator|nr:hypothetical protein [Chloroflexota bacterium]
MIHSMNVLRVAAPTAEDGEYTIDQLAQASGVTVRNIRAHQSRGLMPPPEVRGRTGFYTQEHLARLQLILEMQADGFNLNSIRRILDGMPPGAAGEVLGFERAVRTPWGEEQPEIIDGHELTAIVGTDDSAVAKRAIKLGVLVPIGNGQFEVPSPTLLRAGAELHRLGIDINARLGVQEQVRRHTDGVADAFVKLFLEHVWKPFYEAGEPDDQWPEIREALDRLRPLAREVLVATFHQSIADAIDEALEGVREQQARVGRKRSELREGRAGRDGREGKERSEGPRRASRRRRDKG